MAKKSYESDIILGERYRDEQTGYVGIATGVYFYQHACERVGLEKMKDDGEILTEVFDSPRLVSAKTAIKATSDRPGGPARAGEGVRP